MGEKSSGKLYGNTPNIGIFAKIRDDFFVLAPNFLLIFRIYIDFSHL